MYIYITCNIIYMSDYHYYHINLTLYYIYYKYLSNYDNSKLSLLNRLNII